MGFRDDREAMRARIDALQRENERLAAALEESLASPPPDAGASTPRSSPVEQPAPLVASPSRSSTPGRLPWRAMAVAGAVAGGCVALAVVALQRSPDSTGVRQVPSTPAPTACAFGAGAACIDACRAGDRAACDEAAGGVDPWGEPETAEAIWRIGCEAGAALACLSWAGALDRGGYPPPLDRADFDRALEVALSGCALPPTEPYPWAPHRLCEEADRIAWSVTDAASTSWAPATAALLRGCGPEVPGGGPPASPFPDPGSCALGLHWVRRGRGADLDARALADALCAATGDPELCDPQACATPTGCARAAELLLPDDPEAALAGLARACDAGASTACIAAASAWGRRPEGDGWRAGWLGDDPVAAWRGWSVAAERGAGWEYEAWQAAYDEAHARGRGEAVEAEMRATLERLAPTCASPADRRDNPAEARCRMAFELARGWHRAAPLDAARATRLAAQACERGWNFGCLYGSPNAR